MTDDISEATACGRRERPAHRIRLPGFVSDVATSFIVHFRGSHDHRSRNTRDSDHRRGALQ
jgi:hypothetical protein